VIVPEDKPALVQVKVNVFASTTVTITDPNGKAKGSLCINTLIASFVIKP
jgi:predicted transcriptional regulator YheO